MTEPFSDPEKWTNMRSLEQKNQAECAVNKQEGEKQ